MKKYLAGTLIALVIGSVFFLAPVISRAEDSSSAEVLRKLNEISQSQEKILQSLQEVKSELQVLKVRVTSR